MTKALRAYLDECAAAKAKKCALMPTRVILQNFREPVFKTRGYARTWGMYHDLQTTIADLEQISPGEVNRIVRALLDANHALNDEDAQIRRRKPRARD